MAIALNPAYPMPDRSDQTIHHSRDEDGVIDIGWCDGVMADGRAFRAEMWAQGGVSMLTIFFSRIGIADLDQSQIKQLILAEGLVSFRDGAPQRCEARPFTDTAGAEMWSVNIMVGDEDETFLAASPAILGYARDGTPRSMFNPVALGQGHGRGQEAC